MSILSRVRKFIVTADATTNQTGWITLKNGGVVTIEAASAMTATITLQRQGNDGVVVDVTDNTGTVSTFTKVGTYTINPESTPGLYRLNMKSGAYSAGQPIVMMIEGR